MLLLLCVGTLSGQRITFSVDVQGPTAGLFGSDGSILDSFYNNEIDGADILTTGVPAQPIPPNPNLAALGPVISSIEKPIERTINIISLDV